MGDRGTNTPIGPGLAAIGGVVLAVGSVLTWAKASVDLNAFATALGIDPAQIPASAAAQTTKSFAGTSSTDGKIALACGIVAIVLALGAFARRELSKPFGGLTIVAGLVGGGFALYDISQKTNVIADAKATAGPSLAAAGIDPGILDKIFKVDLGIGIWLCVAGGALAVIGGVLLFMRGPAAVPAMGGMSSAPPDSGFGSPGAPTMPTPAPSMPTPATSSTPMPATEPIPPAAAPDAGGSGTASGEDTGGDGSTTS